MRADRLLAEAKDLLCNRKIVDVRWMTTEERDKMLWDERTLVLVMDDGSKWFASADDEGNHPGQLWGEDSQGNELGFPNP